VGTLEVDAIMDKFTDRADHTINRLFFLIGQVTVDTHEIQQIYYDLRVMFELHGAAELLNAIDREAKKYPHIDASRFNALKLKMKQFIQDNYADIQL
jgi:hypothetical protein